MTPIERILSPKQTFFLRKSAKSAGDNKLLNRTLMTPIERIFADLILLIILIRKYRFKLRAKARRLRRLVTIIDLRLFVRGNNLLSRIAMARI